MFKRCSLIFAAMLMSAMLTGCMSAQDDAQPSATPFSVVTAGPTQMSGYDWQTQANTVEDAVSQLSEVDEARVLVSGNTALVAVKFDNAYQGEVTERIREMVAGIVKNADPAIETVAVTADENDVNDMFTVSDRVRAGEKLEDFKDDILSSVRNIGTMR